jgi:hypothetical protein
MLQIVYISSARPDFEHKEVGRILARARVRNGENNITGLLFYDGMRFMQALEGDDDVVWETFARIKDDPRHYALVVLSQRKVDKREFGSWSMAAQKVDPSGRIDQDELVAAVDALVADVPDANIREQFRSFARIRRSA